MPPPSPLSRLLSLLSLLASARALSLAPAAPAPARLQARQALLEALPPGKPPSLLDALTMGRVNQLEAAGTPPSTAEFLALGIAGRWELLATVRDAAKLEPGFSPAAANAAAGAPQQGAPKPPVPMGVARAEVRVEPTDRTILASAWFQIRDGTGEQIGAKLEVESSFTFEDDAITGKAVVDLRSSNATRLMLPTRDPGCRIDALMEALHARLSPEFSLAAGDEYKLRLQTTYLDESVWITRSAPFCCSVFHRADDEMAWLQANGSA